MKKGFAAVLLVLLFGCSFNNDLEKKLMQGAAPGMEVFAEPYAYSNLTEGIYLGGSLIYNPAKTEFNQLIPGMVFRVRLDKADSSDNSKTQWYNFGFVNIRAINEGSVTIDFIVYDNDGSQIVNKQNETILLGQSISLNNDNIPDLGYVSSISNMSAEYDGSAYLQFMSSKAKLTRALFMLMPDEYPGGSLPSGLVAVNPSGALVVNISSSNVTGAGPFNIEADTGTVPPLKSGDFVVNMFNGKNYRVISAVYGKTVKIKASEMENSSPYELLFMKVKGTVSEIVKKYAPQELMRFKAELIHILNPEYHGYLINNSKLKIKLDYMSDIDLYLDAHAECGFLWAGGQVTVKLINNSMFNISGEFNASFYDDTRQMIACPSMILPCVIPIVVSMPVYIGVEVDAKASGWFKYGINQYTESGSTIFAMVGIPTCAGQIPIEVNRTVVTPFQGEFSGSVSVAPYVCISPQVSIAWILHAGVDIKPYLQGVLSGNVKFTPTFYTGHIAFDLNFGLKGTVWAAIGVDWLGLYQRWDLGQLFDWKKNIYHWQWDVNTAKVSSLTKPQNFTVQKNNDGSIKLAWSPVSLAAGYYIYKATNGVFVNRYFSQEIAYTDTKNVAHGVPVTYSVSAINGTVESSNSTAVTVTNPKPAVPSGFNLTSNPSGSITVAWNSVTGALQYKVIRTAPSLPDKVYYTSSLFMKDTDLTTNKLYSYKVQSINHAGEGDASGVLSESAPLSGAPGGLSVDQRTATMVKLKWNSSLGAVSYLLERTETNSGIKKYYFTSSLEYIDNSLEYEKNYLYKIKSKNYIGYSTNSIVSLYVKGASTNGPMVEIANPTPDKVFLCHPSAGSTNINITGTAKTGGILPAQYVYVKIDTGGWVQLTPDANGNWVRNITLGNNTSHSVSVYCVDSVNKTSFTSIVNFRISPVKINSCFDVPGWAHSIDTDYLGDIYLLRDFLPWGDIYYMTKYKSYGAVEWNTATSGTNNGELYEQADSSPRDIQIYSGSWEVFVLDGYTRKIKVYSPSTGSFLYSFSGMGTNITQFNYVNSFAIAESYTKVFIQGGAWNGVSTVQRVKVFNKTGTYLSYWDTGGYEFKDITFSSGTSRLYALVDNTVKVYTDTGGNMFNFGSTGTGNGQFQNPSGIFADGNYIYVADTGNKRIQVFDTEGVLKVIFGNTGSGDELLDIPGEISVSGNYIYVKDLNKIKIYQKSW